MQDLIAVCVTDAGDERLVAKQVLELARMAPDALPPDIERQARMVGLRAHLVRAEAGYGSIDACGIR